MTRNQIIAVSFCALLGIGIYVFTNHQKPSANDHSHDGHDHAMEDGQHLPPAVPQEILDIKSYLTDVDAKIADPKTLEKIAQLKGANDFKGLVDEYVRLDKPLAVAHYSLKLAEQSNKSEDFVKSGDYHSLLLQTAPDAKAHNFLNQNRVIAYEKAVALDSTNTDYRIRYAGALMESGGPPMQGVAILLDIVRQDSTNVDAQLMLANFGIVSGQFDKAIVRFQKILYLHPQNEEALLGMAQAHESAGNRQEAITALEKYAQVTKSAETKKRVKEYILQLKEKK
jgi:tetratricopeptide (TPR) repeat protein